MSNQLRCTSRTDNQPFPPITANFTQGVAPLASRDRHGDRGGSGGAYAGSRGACPGPRARAASARCPAAAGLCPHMVTCTWQLRRSPAQRHAPSARWLDAFARWPCAPGTAPFRTTARGRCWSAAALPQHSSGTGPARSASSRYRTASRTAPAQGCAGVSAVPCAVHGSRPGWLSHPLSSVCQELRCPHDPAMGGVQGHPVLSGDEQATCEEGLELRQFWRQPFF